MPPATLDQPDTMTRRPSTPRVTAETMAAKQRDISVSEFFAKNRHLLGFDNPRKALLTTVKEAVDNSLDACEEAGILPEIAVIIEDLSEADTKSDAKKDAKSEAAGKKPRVPASSRYRVTVVDNGPGIVRKQVENVFGRLLFGSKFHRLKMSRGQQGIGISAAGMYGLITTGKPMLIQTRPAANKPAHHIELAMNTKTNRAEVTVDEETEDFPLPRLRELNSATRDLASRGEFLAHTSFPTGTSVTVELEGKYQRGRGSVDEFLELTAIANPHARITLVRPTRVSEDEEDVPLLKPTDAASNAPAPAAPAVTADLGPLVLFPRAVNELPPETKEIQPHPRGVELGTLLQMLKDSQERERGGTLYNFLQEKFSRVSPSTAAELCDMAGLTSRTKVADVEPGHAEALYKAFQEVKLLPPPTDCLAPIGVQQLLKGMFTGVRAEFYAASSRAPEVYRGRPFLIEAAIAFGGDLAGDDTSRVIRFANRVPLLFQQSACSSFKAVVETNWRNYDLQQPRGGLPVGPLVIMIHMASVWVPFTSESKEAIADYDEIRKEMKLALMECGRKLGTYLRKRAKMKRESERRDVFERYIGEISQACAALSGENAKKIYESLLAQAKRKTAIADQQLNDEGKVVREEEEDQDGVLIIESAAPETKDADAPPTGGLSKAEAAALKVAALAKLEDDQPQLIDTGKSGRGSKKSAAPAPRADKREPAPKAKTSAPEKPASKTKPATKPEPDAKASPAPKQAAAPAPAPTPAPPKPKLKMRLVNGKLVRVDDEPGLF